MRKWHAALGDLIPPVRLPSVRDGSLVDLRTGRGPCAIVSVHSATCEDCHAYVRSLGSIDQEIAAWGGRLVVVAPGPAGMAAPLHAATNAAFLVLADPDLRFASGQAGVLIADEWGEVHMSAVAGEAHAFPGPGEIVEWLRFLAIQCPECEGPEGDWRTI